MPKPDAPRTLADRVCDLPDVPWQPHDCDDGVSVCSDPFPDARDRVGVSRFPFLAMTESDMEAVDVSRRAAASRTEPEARQQH